MRREIKVRIVLITVSILFFLIVAELVLRNTIIPVEKKEMPFEKSVTIKDDVLGYKLRPNQKTIMSDGYYREEVIINKDGLRNIFNDNYTNPGLIAIGDSYTFGEGVKDEETWVKQLQERLRVNVINAGVPGYNVWQYKYMLRYLYKKGYPIKIVLYAMPWNDIRSGTSIIMGPLGSKLDFQDKPGRQGEKIGKLTLIETIQKSRLYIYITRQSALGRLLYEAISEIFSYFRLKTTPTYDAELGRDIVITQKEILEMVNFLDQIGAKLIIVYIADISFAMPDKWQRYQRRHKYSRDCVRNSFADWAKARGIYFEDAVPELESEYLKSGKKRTSIALQVDNHYNKGAYRIIASVFYRIITKNKLIGP